MVLYLMACTSFRIRSLAKNIQDNIFNEEQRKLASMTLKEKAKIYKQGALKRGRTDVAEEVRKLLKETFS